MASIWVKTLRAWRQKAIDLGFKRASLWVAAQWQIGTGSRVKVFSHMLIQTKVPQAPNTS